MYRFTVSCAVALIMTTAASQSFAGVELYRGTIRIIESSGGACAGFVGEHPVEMLLKSDKGKPGLSGYFAGDEIATGRFSGKDATHLDVRYPYVEEAKASGHFISIATEDGTVQAELHDRHIDAGAEDCNFDLARLTLRRVADEQAAMERYQQLAALFEAQLSRSKALELIREGRNAEALALYEKALSQVDTATRKNPEIVAPYLSSLATAYIRTGRFDEFNRLYDARIDGIKDETLRAFFLSHRVRALLMAGKADLARDDYDGALAKFQMAYLLQPQGKEIMAAIMAAYVRAGKYDNAVAFLEKARKGVTDEFDRKDLDEAIALVYFEKSKQLEKTGKDAEAEPALSKALQLSPDNFHFLIALARLRHKLGNFADAEKLLNDGLDRFKDQAIRTEIIDARDRMRQTEAILKKLREVGS